MFSCSNGGRLCVCGHIKAEHHRKARACCVTVRPGYGCECRWFEDRAPDTAPKEETIPADQNERGIAAKRIWV